MHRRIAGHAFQLQCDIQYFTHTRVPLGFRFKARLLCKSVFQLNVQRRRNQFGQLIHFCKSHVQHTTHIFQRGFGTERSKRDDLRHLLTPIFFRDVLNHFPTAARAKVRIHVGHADTFRIQEALKQQPVLQWINIGDLHGVTHQRTCRRSTARTHRNAARFRKADEVPNNQEVARELHLLNHLDFTIQPFRISS